MTEVLEELHKCRVNLSGAQQPTQLKSLERIDRALFALPKRHPYLLRKRELETLKRVREWTTLGNRTAVQAPPQLFSVCSLGSITWRSTWQALSEADRWTEIWTESLNRDGGWIPLRKFSFKRLGGFRSRRWWTPVDLTKAKYPRSAYSLGIPNDYISDRPLILKLVPNPSIKVYRPCAVDGYHHPAHDPMSETPRLCDGKALDLTDLAQEERCTEYVTGEVSSAHVEFQPLEPDSDGRQDDLTVVDLSGGDAKPGPLAAELVNFFDQRSLSEDTRQ